MHAKKLVETTLSELSKGLLHIEEGYSVVRKDGDVIYNGTCYIVDRHGFKYAKFMSELQTNFTSTYSELQVKDSVYLSISKWLSAGVTNENNRFYSLEDSIKIAAFINNNNNKSKNQTAVKFGMII